MQTSPSPFPRGIHLCNLWGELSTDTSQNVALAGDWDAGLAALSNWLDHHTVKGWLHHVPFLYAYQEGKYDAALEAARRFEQPGFFWNWIDRAAALGRLGRADEARGAIERLQALRPDFGDDPRRYLNCFIFTDDLVENVLDGLREAGL